MADKEAALSAGFDAHLVKPIKFEQLSQLLQRIEAITQPAAPARRDEAS